MAGGTLDDAEKIITDDRLDEETERLLTGLTVAAVAAVAWGEYRDDFTEEDRELERKMDYAESALRSRIRELVSEADRSATERAREKIRAGVHV